MAESSSEVKFDPAVHKELPAESGGGFVTKDAAFNFNLARAAAKEGTSKDSAVFELGRKGIREAAEADLKPGKFDAEAVDLLHAEALEDEKARKKTLLSQLSNLEPLKKKGDGRWGEDYEKLKEKWYNEGIQKFRESLPPDLKRDDKFMLDVIRYDHELFNDASPELRSEESFIKASIGRNWECIKIKSVRDTVEGDRKIMLDMAKAAVRRPRYHERELDDFFRNLPAALTADKDFMRDLVRQNGWALKYASEEAQCDVETVKAAFNELVSDPFDRKAALRGYDVGELFTELTPRARQSMDIIEEAVKHWPYVLKSAPQEIQDVFRLRMELAPEETRELNDLMHQTGEYLKHPEWIEKEKQATQKQFEQLSNEEQKQKKSRLRQLFNKQEEARVFIESYLSTK